MLSARRTDAVNGRFGTRLPLVSFTDSWFDLVSEVRMKNERRNGAAKLLLAAVLLMGTGSLLSACDTVAGAGQDVSAIGHTVTNGASQTQRATGVP
jgi:predicted small secreted protein